MAMEIIGTGSVMFQVRAMEVLAEVDPDLAARADRNIQLIDGRVSEHDLVKSPMKVPHAAQL